MEKRKILVVDPDPHHLALLELSLRGEGYIVFIEHDGLAAVESIRLLIPDLIVCDVKTPKLDGYGLLKKIRHDSSLRPIPVIFMAEKHSVEDKIRGLEFGLDDYLTKPVFIKEFLTRVALVFAREARQSLLSYRTEQGVNVFRGNQDDMSLIDFFQHIESIGRSSRLTLENAETKELGELIAVEGSLKSVTLRRRTGYDAFCELLRWQRWNFEVEFTYVEKKFRFLSQLGLDKPIKILLAEGLRYLDECREREAALRFKGQKIQLREEDRERFKALFRSPEAASELETLFVRGAYLKEIIAESSLSSLSLLKIWEQLEAENLITDVQRSMPNTPLDDKAEDESGSPKDLKQLDKKDHDEASLLATKAPLPAFVSVPDENERIGEPSPLATALALLDDDDPSKMDALFEASRQFQKPSSKKKSRTGLMLLFFFGVGAMFSFFVFGRKWSELKSEPPDGSDFRYDTPRLDDASSLSGEENSRTTATSPSSQGLNLERPSDSPYPYERDSSSHVADEAGVDAITSATSIEELHRQKKELQKLMDRGQYLKMIQLSRLYLATQPQDGDVWLLLAAGYQLIGDGVKAQEAFRSCVDLGRGPKVAECRQFVQKK